MNSIILNEYNSNRIGRTADIGKSVCFALSGSGVRFEFTGRRLSIELLGDDSSRIPDNKANYARIGIFVNGKRVLDFQMDSPEKTVDIISSEERITADVRIIKLSECAMSTVGIRAVLTDDEGSISPCPPMKRRISFIGDSITCGYGVDDEDPLHGFQTATEDVTRAYAYKTAELLHADYSIFSISGYGIISGYTEGERKPEQTIPQYYGSLGFSYQRFPRGDHPQDVKWHRNCGCSGTVVINLGTNDDSYCKDDPEKQQFFTDEYVRFLADVRSSQPKADIICTVGIMGQRIYPAVEKAVRIFKEQTGDEKVFTMLFDEQLPEDGLVCDYHPTEATHTKAAARLAEEIRRIKGWDD